MGRERDRENRNGLYLGVQCPSTTNAVFWADTISLFHILSVESKEEELMNWTIKPEEIEDMYIFGAERFHFH